MAIVLPTGLWIMILSGLVGAGCEKIPPAGITRPNYGVDFNFLYAVNNMHGSWKHVWTVDLSLLDREITLNADLRCDQIDPMCEPAKHLFSMISGQLANATGYMQKQFSWAHDPSLLATINRFDGRRRKRALLPFVGDIEKFFFGTATESDVNALKATLEDMEKLHGDTIGQITNLGDNLASLTQILNDQIANTKKGFLQVKSTFTNLTKQVNDRYHEIMKTLSKESDIVKYNSLAVAHTWSALEALLPRFLDVTKLLVADSQLLSGIQTILQGFIPISLVSPTDLRQGLVVALDGIVKQFPSARLSHPVTALGYYYTHKIVTPYFKGDSISLIVDIPIDLGQDILYVYAIRTFPVAILPYNPYSHQIDPSSHLMKAQAELSTKFSHFLVSADGLSWSTATHSEMSSCVGESIKVCKHQFAMYRFMNTMCLEKIWNNFNFDEILKSCSYQLSHPGSSINEENHVQVTPLSNGRWYIEAPLNEQWTITCPSRAPEKRASCTSCVVQVDCGCGINSKYFTIPTRVSSCESIFSPLQRNFTLNPFNYQPKNQPWVVNLTGDNNLPYPPKMDPDIKLPDSGTWDDVMENMDSRRYDLNKLYEKQQNESKMFRTEAEALLQKIRQQDKLLSNLSSWPNWVLGSIVFLTFGNTAMIILFVLCTFARVHAKSLGDELKIIEGTEEAILDLEIIQFILVLLSFLLLCIMGWPIIQGWIHSTSMYRKFTNKGQRIKALKFRKVRRGRVIMLQGILHFSQEGKTVERSIPGICLLASVPQGTHMDQVRAPVVGNVTMEGQNYQLMLNQSVSILFHDETLKSCTSVGFGFDYVHRKVAVPMTSRWTKLTDGRLWIE